MIDRKTLKDLVKSVNRINATVSVLLKDASMKNIIIEPLKLNDVDAIYNEIVDLVNNEFNTNVKNRTRKPDEAEARRVICYLLRQFTNLSLGEIGKFVKVRDHTSVRHNIIRCKELMNTYPEYAMQVAKLSSTIRYLAAKYN